VAQVQVGLGAVLGDEDLAVLERAHGARIHVDVGVQLEMGDLEAARFEDRAQRSGGDALAQGGHNATGNEERNGS
jgi:nucleotide-binding universal stress UspA family protein